MVGAVVHPLAVALVDDQRTIALTLGVENEYGAALAAGIVVQALGGNDVHTRLIDSIHILQRTVLVVPLIGDLVVLTRRKRSAVSLDGDRHTRQVIAIGGAGFTKGHLQVGGLCDNGEVRRSGSGIVAHTGDGHAGSLVPHRGVVLVRYIFKIHIRMERQVPVLNGDLRLDRLPGVVLVGDGLDHVIRQCLGIDRELLGEFDLTFVVPHTGHSDGVAARIDAVAAVGHGKVPTHDQGVVSNRHRDCGVLCAAIVDLAVVCHLDSGAAQVGLLNDIFGCDGLTRIAPLAPDRHGVSAGVSGNLIDSDHTGSTMEIAHRVIIGGQGVVVTVCDLPFQNLRSPRVGFGYGARLHSEGVLGPAGVVGHAGIANSGLAAGKGDRIPAVLRVVPAVEGVALLRNQRHSDFSAGGAGDRGRYIVGDVAAVEYEADGNVAHPDSGKGHIAVNDQVLDLLRSHGLTVQTANPTGGGGSVLGGGGHFGQLPAVYDGIAAFAAADRRAFTGVKGHRVAGITVLCLQGDVADDLTLGQLRAGDRCTDFQVPALPFQAAAGDLPVGKLFSGGRCDGGRRRDALIDGGDCQRAVISGALVAVVILGKGYIIGIGTPDGNVGGTLGNGGGERGVGAAVHLAILHIHPPLEGVAGQGNIGDSGESGAVAEVLHHHIVRAAAHAAAVEPEGDGVLGILPHGHIGLGAIEGHVAGGGGSAVIGSFQFPARKGLGCQGGDRHIREGHGVSLGLHVGLVLGGAVREGTAIGVKGNGNGIGGVVGGVSHRTLGVDYLTGHIGVGNDGTILPAPTSQCKACKRGRRDISLGQIAVKGFCDSACLVASHCAFTVVKGNGYILGRPLGIPGGVGGREFVGTIGHCAVLTAALRVPPAEVIAVPGGRGDIGDNRTALSLGKVFAGDGAAVGVEGYTHIAAPAGNEHGVAGDDHVADVVIAHVVGVERAVPRLCPAQELGAGLFDSRRSKVVRRTQRLIVGHGVSGGGAVIKRTTVGVKGHLVVSGLKDSLQGDRLSHFQLGQIIRRKLHLVGYSVNGYAAGRLDNQPVVEGIAAVGDHRGSCGRLPVDGGDHCGITELALVVSLIGHIEGLGIPQGNVAGIRCDLYRSHFRRRFVGLVVVEIQPAQEVLALQGENGNLPFRHGLVQSLAGDLLGAVGATVCTAVVVEGDGIGGGFILRIVILAAGGVGEGQGLGGLLSLCIHPLDEGMLRPDGQGHVGHGEVGRRGNLIGLRVHSARESRADLRERVGVEGHGIARRAGEVSGIGGLAPDDLTGDLRIDGFILALPAHKGVAAGGEIGGDRAVGHMCQSLIVGTSDRYHILRLCPRIVIHIQVFVEGDGVGLGRPAGGQGFILGGELSQILAPDCEGIALAGGGCRLLIPDDSAGLAGDGLGGLAAIPRARSRNVGDGHVRRFKDRLEGDVAPDLDVQQCFGGVSVAYSDIRIGACGNLPVLEHLAVRRGDRRSCRCAAIDRRDLFVTAIGIIPHEGHGVLHRVPDSQVGLVLGDRPGGEGFDLSLRIRILRVFLASLHIQPIGQLAASQGDGGDAGGVIFTIVQREGCCIRGRAAVGVKRHGDLGGLPLGIIVRGCTIEGKAAALDLTGAVVIGYPTLEGVARAYRGRHIRKGHGRTVGIGEGFFRYTVAEGRVRNTGGVCMEFDRYCIGAPLGGVGDIPVYLTGRHIIHRDDVTVSRMFRGCGHHPANQCITGTDSVRDVDQGTVIVNVALNNRISVSVNITVIQVIGYGMFVGNPLGIQGLVANGVGFPGRGSKLLVSIPSAKGISGAGNVICRGKNKGFAWLPLQGSAVLFRATRCPLAASAVKANGNFGGFALGPDGIIGFARLRRYVQYGTAS